MRVGAVAFAHETIKHIWKWADSMTNSLQFEPRHHLSKMPVLSKWAIIQLSMSLRPLWSLFLSVEDFTAQKKNTLEKPLVCMLSAVMPKMRIKFIQRKLSVSTSLLSLILPLLSLPATPSSELRSKYERMAQRFAQRESWPPQSLRCPWTKVLLKAGHIHGKLILRSVPKLSFTLDQRSCFYGRSLRQPSYL